MNLTIAFDAANQSYTFTLPAGYVIIAVTDSVYESHWDSGHPDTPAKVFTLWSDDLAHHFEAKEAVSPRTRYVEDADGRIVNINSAITCRCIVPEVNATDDQVLAYQSALAAEAYIKDILDVASNALSVVKGSIVEVFKGRKVPKGNYKVEFLGAGQYGDFAHLLTLDGKKRFSFVSTENLKPVPDYVAALNTTKRYTEYDWENKFLAAIASSGFTDKTAWLVLADYIQDGNLPFSHDGRDDIDPALFARRFRIIGQQEDVLVQDAYSGRSFSRPARLFLQGIPF